jgi:ElaB/YqjD/DUF883 family membrane-anchored ribosome-binding protein
MTTDDPDQLRRDIERTQRNLSTDVNLLAEKVTPGRIMHRRVNRARTAMTTMRDRVMGTASDSASTVSDRVSAASNRVGEAATSTAQAVGEAPQAVRRGTEGNPLAAGLIAFGAGWLISSLAPPSKQEQRLAEQAKDWVTEHGQPVAQQVASDLKENLREPAQQAVEEVKSTATDAASTVADETRTAASDVTDRAQQAKSSVQEQRS